MKTKEKAKVRIKYARKQLIIIAVLIIFAASFILTLSRYVMDKQKDFFSRSQEFYFSSDKLSEQNPEYTLSNWSGQGTYTMTINMGSKQNDLIAATYDIGYNISCAYSNNIICSLNKNTRSYICKYEHGQFYYNNYSKYNIENRRYSDYKYYCCSEYAISENNKRNI